MNYDQEYVDTILAIIS